MFDTIVLRANQQKFVKRKFDSSKKEDLLVYKIFITTGSWGASTCPFTLEWPHLTVPAMIENKIAQYTVRNL
jgi:hypothetical protein